MDKYLFEYLLSVLLDKHLEVELLGLMVTLRLTLRNPKPFQSDRATLHSHQ